jgi:hypothetical protein
MDVQKKADEFVKELRSVVEKHYGSLPKDEVEPFGMKLRKILPAVSGGDDSVTTTATITLPIDTDPPDSDD